jgi:nicotinate-nucleotide pyrophosphorylase (carboxylating)
MSVENFVQKALEEDLGRGDLFASIFESFESQARLISKDNGTFAGKVYGQSLVDLVGCKIHWQVEDGQKISHGDLLANLEGDGIKLLQIERTLLNILQHASGIATQTARFVEALGERSVRLLDTRKTRPNLRSFEKYAVRCGGGHNHRFGLDDALMLKDTHLALIDNLLTTIQKARKTLPFTTMIEIECESLEGAKEAMNAGADIVMCDNMDCAKMAQVVAYKRANFPHVLLEASGNVTMERLGEIAKTGVDAISAGSLIHQATWLDFSMKMESRHGVG